MSHSPLELLKHVLNEVEFLCSESTALDEVSFENDEKSKRAFVRSLEIIGKASKNISDDFKRKYPHLEWKAMARLPDSLGYSSQ